MPSRNVVKVYVPEGTYHVYNRGVEKREIFADTADFDVFTQCMETYLRAPTELNNDRLCRATRWRLPLLDLWQRVELLAWCLMPNHIHLVLRQHDETGMTEFMRRLGNAYVAYFNGRHKRVGALFQGRYKAVLVDDSRFLPVTRYVHRNPLGILPSLGLDRLEDYRYSSYPDYLRRQTSDWLCLSRFDEYYPEGKVGGPNEMSYQEYVEYDIPHESDIIRDLALDEA